MAQDIVSGLFGLSPYQVQQQRNAALEDFAAKQAQRSLAQQATYGLSMGGGQLAQGLGGMLGMVDPAVEEAKRREAALSGIDISSPEGLLARAQATDDPRIKMQLMLLAQDMQDKATKRRLDEAHAKYYEQGGASGATRPLTQTELARVTKSGYALAIQQGKTGIELANFVNSYVQAVRSGQIPVPTDGAEAPAAISTSNNQPTTVSGVSTVAAPAGELSTADRQVIAADMLARGDIEGANKILAAPTATALTAVKTPSQLAAERAFANAKARVKGAAEGAPLDDATIDTLAAEQRLTGKTPSWIVGENKAKILRRATEQRIADGLSPEGEATRRMVAQQDIKALGGTLAKITTRNAAIDQSMMKIENDLKTLEQTMASGNLDLPVIASQPLNWLRTKASDPALTAYALAVKQVATEYERLLTGGALSVAQLHEGARQDAQNLINENMTVAQVKAVLPVMIQEMNNAKRAGQDIERQTRERLNAVGSASPLPPSAPSTVPKSRVDMIPTGTAPVRKYNPVTGKIE